MSRTTLAETLSAVFLRLHAVPTGLSLWKAWSTIFADLGPSDFARMAGVSVIAQAMEQLESQVRESKMLKGYQKNSGREIISTLRPALDVGAFHVGFDAHRGNYRPETCGQLSFLGHALASEFGEAALEAADAEAIKKLLVELLEALDSSSIDLDLRLALRRQIQGLIWWVSNPDIVSVQSLFQRLGESVVLAGQINERGDGGDVENQEKSRTIWDRTLSVFNILKRMVHGADATMRAVDQLSSDAHHTIEAIRQSL